MYRYTMQDRKKVIWSLSQVKENIMPIYEYICNTCEHNFEQLVTNTSDEIICPECAGTDVKKMISAPALSINMSSDSGQGCNPKSPFS